jgi:hypothetical protein
MSKRGIITSCEVLDDEVEKALVYACEKKPKVSEYKKLRGKAGGGTISLD